MVDKTTLTCAIPPAILRVRREEKRSSLEVIPVLFIRFPAKIKNGTARNAIDWVCATTLCTVMEKGIKSLDRKKTAPEIPMVKPIGMLMTRRKKNVTTK
jgi:hypothetical protein